MTQGLSQKAKREWRNKKTGSSLGCQFSHIMGKGENTPLGLDFGYASQGKPAESSIEFDVSENGFGFGGTFLA